jgi:hypothetical protein
MEAAWVLLEVVRWMRVKDLMKVGMRFGVF